jgi:4-oxalocrotonate tautomerase
LRLIEIDLYTASNTIEPRAAMPLITVRLTRRDTPMTTQTKTSLVAGMTRLLVETLGKRAEDVVVLIDEIDPDNWGQGGVTATELRRARGAARSG